jgi:Fe-S cluster biosynthesis and repair protein YggX
MAAQTVHCAKLGRDLPGIDENNPAGSQALRMVQMIGGPDLRRRVHDHISAEAWELWKGQMLMIMNEFRLDPSSDQANQLLKQYMEAFFFGEEQEVPNYVPKEQ